MVQTNQYYDLLPAGYLFPEIKKRMNAFKEQHPGVEVLRLGIGDTTEPITPTILKGLMRGVEKLGNVSTYTGYGDEQGDSRLREAIARYYAKRKTVLDPSEVFVSDGAKSDIANVQSIFSANAKVAVQDPVYPVYVDTNVIAGRGGKLSKDKFDQMVYMPCTAENDFVPEIPNGDIDIIYLCSPNNPTGVVMTKKQLKVFVDHAIEKKAVILFDAAYETYIKDDDLPHSIYEIKGAETCAIEINSFSKSAGFTGVRLGWTIVPKSLVIEDGSAGKVNALWNRRQTTFFNGASNIAQEGGIAALSDDGQKEVRQIVHYYMENAKIIKKGLSSIGLEVYGGENAPYLWLKTPGNISSWEFFDKLLKEANVVGTPGSGFGPHGEGYFRLSAFGHREQIVKAVESIIKNLKR